MNGAPVIFLLGLGGTGKTTLAGWLAEDFGLLHVELDRFPENGFDAECLREAWDRYIGTGRADRLAATVRDRAAAAGRRGAVLSFPGVMVLRPGQIRAAEREGIRTFVLFGSRDECLRTFLRRERASGRGLDEVFWDRNNEQPCAAYGGDAYSPHRVSAFESGEHRSRAALVAEIGTRLAGAAPAG